MLHFVSICRCSDSARVDKTDEAETQQRHQSATVKDEHPTFFVDRKKAISPAQKQCEETEPIDVGSSSDDDEPTTPEESDGADSDASNSDNSDVAPSDVKDPAASISDTSDDEVTFKVSAPERSATKSTPIRKTRPDSAVKKMTMRRRSLKPERTPDVQKVAVSSSTESCLPLTDKENRLASRGNIAPANVIPKSGAKTSPRKATKTVCICSLSRISVNLNQDFRANAKKRKIIVSVFFSRQNLMIARQYFR